MIDGENKRKLSQYDNRIKIESGIHSDVALSKFTCRNIRIEKVGGCCGWRASRGYIYLHPLT